MKFSRKSLIFLISIHLILQMFFIAPILAVTINSSEISPSIFSPGDGNGLNDTITITVESTSSQSLYVNIFNDQSELIAEDRLMNENPSGTYKYTWNGKNDSNRYVTEGTYTIRISDNPAYNGDTIGTTEVDLTPPSSPSISINGGASYTTARNVSLVISASGASKMKVSNYANFSGATWENYATSKSYQLSSGDGTKTVYINFKDQAGSNVSTSDSISLDTAVSTPSLSINDGATSTSSLNVELTITASDATYMKIDNDTAFSNMSSWIAKVNTYNFTLPSGSDGSRIVYLRVKDNAGNTKTTSDSITVDTQAPTGLSISIDNSASYTNTVLVNLTLSASGGPSKVYLSNDGTSWTRYDYSTSLSWNLTSSDGLKTVHYKAADAAGNNATKITAQITLDTTDPSPVTLSSPTSAATISTQTPQFAWADPNSDTKNYYIQILQSGNSVQSSYSNSTTYNANTLATGSYSWKVTVYDRANNSASTSQRSFTISVTGLPIPSPTYPQNGAKYNNSIINTVLRWSQVTSATYYDVKYGLSSGNLNYSGTSVQYGLSYTISNPTLAHGDTIYWRVRARNSTTSTNYSSVLSFIIDTQAPTNQNISIKAGDLYTTSTTVTLILSATGANYMMLSNYGNFSGASWESYKTTKSWTLVSGDGTKTVYFKTKDNSVGDQGSTDYANIASVTSDNIILDTTAPTVTAQSPSSGGSTTTTTNLAIRATLNDSGSGINTSAVTMIVDGSSVTPTQVTSSLCRYVMPSISTGSHWVNITATDNVGYIGYKNWTFSVTSSSGETPGGETPGFIPTVLPSSITISHEPSTITNTDYVIITANINNWGTDFESVDLIWNDSTTHSKPMSLKTNTTYTATIGPFSEGTTVTYSVLALNSASQELSSSTSSFTIKDYNSPIISSITPTNGSVITNQKPTIKITFSDPGGIDTSSIKITVNNVDVTADSTITSTSIVYTPSSPLSYSEHKVKVEIADKSGNIITKTWSFTITPAELEITKIVDKITKGEIKTISLENYNIALEEIKITTSINLENVKFDIKTLTEKPTDIPAPSKTIYMYLSIETNAEANDFSLVTITFKVEKSWFEEKNINKNSVLLSRFYNNNWQEFTTTKTSEDDLYVHYQADIPGFSTFAILGSEISERGIQKFVFSWPIAIVAIVAVIILVIIILFKLGFFYFEEDEETDDSKIKNKK